MLKCEYSPVKTGLFWMYIISYLYVCKITMVTGCLGRSPILVS